MNLHLKLPSANFCIKLRLLILPVLEQQEESGKQTKNYEMDEFWGLHRQV